MIDLEWMAWTTATAAFFATIAVILITMTVWEIRSPSIERKGFLPMPTTRGDRLFLSLMSAALIHLVWIDMTDTSVLWLPLGISVAWGVTMMRFG